MPPNHGLGRGLAGTDGACSLYMLFVGRAARRGNTVTSHLREARILGLDTLDSITATAPNTI